MTLIILLVIVLLAGVVKGMVSKPRRKPTDDELDRYYDDLDVFHDYWH